MRVRVRAGLIVGLMSLTALLAGCGGKNRVKLEVQREVVPVAPVIESVSAQPSGLDTRAGARTVKVTLRGDPGLQATFDAQGMFDGRAMTEGPAGVYSGSFDVPQGYSGNLVVTGHLVHPPSGAAASRAGSGSMAFFVGEDLRPTSCTPEMARAFDAQLQRITAYFPLDSFELSEPAKRLLTENRAVVTSNELCPIYVLAHTDDLGSERYNEVLSVRRMISVGSFLESLGVDGDRLYKHPLGEKHPAESGDSEEARARNRRVELRAVYPY